MRNSGNTSSSVRFTALGKYIFTERGIAVRAFPSVALGKGFPECKAAFPECCRHSGDLEPPVVYIYGASFVQHVFLTPDGSSCSPFVYSERKVVFSF